MFNTARFLKQVWTSFNIMHERFIEDLITYLPFKDKHFDFFFFFSILFSMQKDTHQANCGVQGIVKWGEPCKCVILLVSRILWHKRINPYFESMEILIFDTHQRLCAKISLFEFTQRHSSEGCLFTSKKPCDVEC